MATANIRTEGYRAQVVEYIRKHPGVLSTDLRAVAAKFKTDEERLSKTVWAARAAGLIVHQKVDPNKPTGPSRYWVTDEAPAELKADVKLARELLKKGITMTEHRKQQAEGTVKSAAKKAAPEVPKTRQPRKSKAAETAQAPAPAPEPVLEANGKGRKKVSSPKLPAANPAMAKPTALVTPISLEHVAQQPSLFEEPVASSRASRRPRAVPAPAQVPQAPAAPVALPDLSQVLDPARLAESLQPIAGALSDVLAQMVIGQTMQKVQQGFGGLSMALAQGIPQPQIPAPAPSASPAPLSTVSRPAEPVSSASNTRVEHPLREATTTPAQESTTEAQGATAPAVTAASTETSFDAVADAVADATTDAGTDAVTEPAPVIRRPVLHTPPVPVKEPKQPKVLIVGLIPHQAGIINAEFHEAYDLRFAEAETPAKRLETMAKDCDRVIIMTNFISHSTQDTLKNHPGFERMQGGVTRVKDRLTELFIASSEAAA